MMVSEENCEGTQPLRWSRNGANWQEAEVQTGRAERGLWHFALHTEASGSRAAAISYLLRPSWVRCDSSIAEFDSPKPRLTYGDLHLFQIHQNFYVLLWFLFYCCSHLVFHRFPHSSSPPLLLMVFTMLAVLCGLQRPCSARVCCCPGARATSVTFKVCTFPECTALTPKGLLEDSSVCSFSEEQSVPDVWGIPVGY